MSLTCVKRIKQRFETFKKMFCQEYLALLCFQWLPVHCMCVCMRVCIS